MILSLSTRTHYTNKHPKNKLHFPLLTKEHMFYIINSMLQPFQDLFARLRLNLAPPEPSFRLEPALRAALLQLAEKEHRPPQELHADLLASALAQRQAHTDLVRRWQSLSPREQEVAALACRNYTNRQVAARLGVSPETIKTHVRNALVKFNLHGKSELRMAIGEWDFSEWDQPRRLPAVAGSPSDTSRWG